MKIFKGDDTGGILGLSLTIKVNTERDLTGCIVFFNYQGIVRKWENVHDGDLLELFFSHNETAKMSVGTFKGVMFAVDPAGKYCTIDNAIPITVTTNLRDCYGDNRFEVTVGNAVGWENIIHKPFEGLVVDLSTDDKQLAALGTIIEKLGGTVKASIVLLALCAATAFGYTPEAHTNSFERNGVTYAQRGGLGASDYVVTNIDAEAVSKVKSVNGRVGDVVLDAAAVNALPDSKDELVSNEIFKDAVATVSPPVELPQKWALANVTNANGETVNASDVGALPLSGGVMNSAYIYGVYGIGGTEGGWLPRIQFDSHSTLNKRDGIKWYYGGSDDKDEIAVKGDVSGLASSKADRPALPVTAGNLAALTADGNLSDSGISKDSVVTRDESGTASAGAFKSSATLTDYIYNQGAGAPWIDVKNGALSPDIPDAKWYYLGTTDDREIAVKGDIADATYTKNDIDGKLAEKASVDDLGRLDPRVQQLGDALGTINLTTRALGGGDWYVDGDVYTSNGDMLSAKADIIMISATNPTFSNAVLAVNLDFTTNTTGAAYVAVTNALAGFGFDAEALAELPGGKVYGSIGGLLAALAAAIAWLKKNKVQTLKLEDESIVKTADNGVAKLDDFFTESNSLLNGRLAYERNETGLKDRAFNTLSFDGTEYNLSTALAAVTPTASGQPRDLLIVATATAATTISFTAGTIKGDKPTIDGSGTWLITLTEYASGVWYCRQIKMEDAA